MAKSYPEGLKKRCGNCEHHGCDFFDGDSFCEKKSRAKALEPGISEFTLAGVSSSDEGCDKWEWDGVSKT